MRPFPRSNKTTDGGGWGIMTNHALNIGNKCFLITCLFLF